MPSVSKHPPKASQASPKLQLKLDGEFSSHPIAKLDNVQYRNGLNKQISNCKIAEINLAGLPRWNEEHRLNALIFLAELNSKVEFYLGPETPVGCDLLDAVLRIRLPQNDLKRFEVVKATAILVVALLHPKAIEPAISKILAYFKGEGLKGVTKRQLTKEAEQVCKEVEEVLRNSEEAVPLLLSECVPSLSNAGDLQVPLGWSLSEEGVSRDGGEIAITAPLFISEIHKDLRTGKVWVTIRWRAGEKWESETVTRDVIATKRQIVSHLALRGCPVDENNAQIAIAFLSAFESTNRSLIKTCVVTSQLGWQDGQDSPSFLLGHQHLSPRLTVGGTSGDSQVMPVRFQGGDDGDRQIADAFRCSGELNEWIRMLRDLHDFPHVMYMVYASMSAPMLSLFDSPNFFVSIAGRTSSGKTTVLRVAASVWGYAIEQAPASVLKTWSGTPVSRERTFAVHNNMPIILDDSKLANPADVGTAIYNLVDGRGRARGSVNGMAPLATWNTVGITGGEQPITSFTQDGGTRPRVHSFFGQVFGEQSPSTGKLVRRINNIVKSHYGYPGRTFVQYILDNWKDREQWRLRYRNEHKKFIGMAGRQSNTYAERLAPNFASISTTAWLAHQALTLPWDYTDPVEPLWESLAESAGEANRAAAALRFVMDWAVRHQNEFFGVAQLSGSQLDPVRHPNQRWAGRWDIDSWEWIGFIPSRLTELLEQGGFEAEAIIRTWKDDGWLRTTEPGRNQLNTRIGKSNARVIAIRKTVIDDVCG